MAAGALGEYIEDQFHPINDATAQFFFEVACLGRTDGMVEDHRIRMVLPDCLPNLGQFSCSDEETWVGFILVAGDYAEGRDACGGNQLDKFIPVLAELRGTKLDVDQYGSLPARKGFNQCPAPQAD